jgi:hypothetical protein
MDSAAISDVFISYSHEDRASANRFAKWCAAFGWTVWWDEAIAPGRKWDQAIERALADSRCVLVLWSAHSVTSDWVKNEAAEAARRGVLVPVLIEPISLPLEFRRVQTLDLTGAWDPSGPALHRLRIALTEHIGRPASDPASTLALTRRSPWSWRGAAAAALVVILAGAALLQVLPRVTTQATSPRPASTGADVALMADEQRQVVIDKANKSGYFWIGMLEKEGGALMLELFCSGSRRCGAPGGPQPTRRCAARWH